MRKTDYEKSVARMASNFASLPNARLTQIWWCKWWMCANLGAEQPGAYNKIAASTPTNFAVVHYHVVLKLLSRIYALCTLQSPHFVSDWLSDCWGSDMKWSLRRTLDSSRPLEAVGEWRLSAACLPIHSADCTCDVPTFWCWGFSTRLSRKYHARCWRFTKGTSGCTID